MPVRIAKLKRRSTDEKHQPYTLDAQDAKLEAYITSQDDWELSPGCDYTDEMSGATLDRPDLQRALRDARLGRYDVLLVYRVDRLARTIRGLAQILEELDKAGVAFRSATEPFDTATPAGRMMVQMLGVFAEFERAMIIDRVINGMTQKAAKGQWTMGHRPYGYQVDPTTHYLVPDEIEAPLVALIFDLYVNERLGARAIAMRLNGRGHRTKAGKPWGPMAVLTVLRNRVYLGEVYFREHYHPAPHQPLVEQTTFKAAQELLAERGEDHARRASNPSIYLLAGKVRCTGCGKHFVGNAARGNRYRDVYDTCFSRQRYGTTTCPSERLPADQLDQAVLDALLATYQHSELFDRAVRASRGHAQQLQTTYATELAALPGEIRKAETAIERYLDAFEAGSLPEQQCGQRVEKLGVRITELQTRQRELRDLLEETRALQPPTQAALNEWCVQINDAVANGTMPAKKALIGALMEEIRVDSRERIVPVFRVPYGQATEKVRALYELVPSARPVPPLRRSLRLTQQVTLPTTTWRKSRRRAAGAS